MVFESRQHPVGRLLDRLRAAQGDADVRHSIEGRALGEQGRRAVRGSGTAAGRSCPKGDRGSCRGGRRAGSRPRAGRSSGGRFPGRTRRLRSPPRRREATPSPPGTRASRSRKAASPDSSKIARMVRPDVRSISVSTSTNGRPRRSATRRPTDGLAARHEPDEKDPPGRAAPARGIESRARVLFDAAVRVEGADHRGGVGARVPDGVEPVQRNPADGDEGLRLGGRHAAERVQAPGGADALGRALEDRPERDVVRGVVREGPHGRLGIVRRDADRRARRQDRPRGLRRQVLLAQMHAGAEAREARDVHAVVDEHSTRRTPVPPTPRRPPPPAERGPAGISRAAARSGRRRRTAAGPGRRGPRRRSRRGR